MLDRGNADTSHHLAHTADVPEGAFRQTVMRRRGDLLEIRTRRPVPRRACKRACHVPARDSAYDASGRRERFAVECIPWSATHRRAEECLIEYPDRLERMRGAASRIGRFNRILEIVIEHAGFARSIRTPLDRARRL